MSTMLKNLTKLHCSGQDFYLLTASQANMKDGLSLTLTDMNKVFVGTITEEDFIKLSEKAKINSTSYKLQTLEAMIGENKERLEYEVRDADQGFIQLIWKKVIDGEDIKVQLGCVTLQQQNDSLAVIRRMFDDSIDLIGQQKKQVVALTSERDHLIKEKTAAFENLEKYSSIKEDTERDLYSKFVIVLNDKKAKLRELKSQLASLSAQTSSKVRNRSPRVGEEPMESTSRESREKESSSHVISDDSEYETDTDDEAQDRNSSRGHGPASINNKNDDDDDLVLDDPADSDDNVPIATKRPRKVKNAASNSKPVILKVPSSNARSSIDKSGLNQSKSINSSSFNSSNADDLIEAMD